MDLDLFASAIRQVAPLTNQVALHLMGEPLLHPQLSEMVQICAEQDLKIFLVTNGILLLRCQCFERQVHAECNQRSVW